MRFLWTGWEIPSFLKGHCGLRCCNGALLMWSQIQLPFFALGLCVCSWETKHLCKQIFCNVAGEKGNLEATADIFPEHEKLRCPLLKWWIICLILCCHMRFPFGASPGTLNQGIDSLVLPPLLCCFTSSQGENYFPQNSIGDAVTSCCDNVQWCKVSSEAKLFLMQISMESCGWAALWKVEQATALPEGGKGKLWQWFILGDKNGCNCQLHWEKWTLKGFKDGQGEGCGFSVLLGMCMCPGLLVVLGSSLPDCFAPCASRS